LRKAISQNQFEADPFSSECEMPPVDLESVMREIDDARDEEAARLLRLQELL
jgi:hypothetical protein